MVLMKNLKTVGAVMGETNYMCFLIDNKAYLLKINAVILDIFRSY
jgi:hypothetical protein